MAQDITAIIDGIKGSIEAVGRSGRDEIYIDNISFRVDASEFVVPHDSNLSSGRKDAETLLEYFDITECKLDTVNVIANDTEIQEEIVAFLLLPTEWSSKGQRLDMTVTVGSSDVTNDLPQTVLVSELFLRGLAESLEVVPGRITFNVAYAYVLWEDIERLIDPEEIEIPR